MLKVGDYDIGLKMLIVIVLLLECASEVVIMKIIFKLICDVAVKPEFSFHRFVSFVVGQYTIFLYIIVLL